MTTPPEVDHKIRQHDNDIRAIYEIVARLETTQTEHSRRFDGIDARFDGIERRLDGHDARFDGIERRLDGHDARFDTLESKVDTLGTQMGEVLTLLRDRP